MPSGGAIAGIVIGSVGGVLIMVSLLYMVIRSTRKPKDKPLPEKATPYSLETGQAGARKSFKVVSVETPAGRKYQAPIRASTTPQRMSAPTASTQTPFNNYSLDATTAEYVAAGVAPVDSSDPSCSSVSVNDGHGNHHNHHHQHHQEDNVATFSSTVATADTETNDKGVGTTTHVAAGAISSNHHGTSHATPTHHSTSHDTSTYHSTSHATSTNHTTNHDTSTYNNSSSYDYGSSSYDNSTSYDTGGGYSSNW